MLPCTTAFVRNPATALARKWVCHNGCIAFFVNRLAAGNPERIACLDSSNVLMNMNTLDHPLPHLLRAGTVVFVFAASALSAAPPPHAKVIASQRRNDLTAGGSAQRIGMLRHQQRTQRMLDKQTPAADSKKK